MCILSHGVDSLHCNYPVSASLRQRCDQWQCDKVAARHYVTTGDIAAWDQTLATLRITSKWRCIVMCIAEWDRTLATLRISLWQPHKTLLGTHGDQLPSLSGGHGSKDFLCSAHLVEAFDGRIYSLKHFHKCKFVHQRPQQDEQYRENPWNHELLKVRGVDCHGYP